MDLIALVLVGLITGVTTVMFGFGGGFVTVPVIMWADAALGEDTAVVAVATSSAVMVVNAAVATAATKRDTLRRLRGTTRLCLLLGAGGALGALVAQLVPSALIHVAFVIYLLVTIADVLLRPGFLRRTVEEQRTDRPVFPIPTVLGLPIGAIASFLGVGGSVMTVPLLRRRGLPMSTAAPLANPLTLAISLPALVVFLLGTPPAGGAGIVGTIDLRAAAALLVSAIPAIVVLRRRPPRVPDGIHAWAYLGLLIVVTLAAIGAAWLP